MIYWVTYWLKFALVCVSNTERVKSVCYFSMSSTWLNRFQKGCAYLNAHSTHILQTCVFINTMCGVIYDT